MTILVVMILWGAAALGVFLGVDFEASPGTPHSSIVAASGEARSDACTSDWKIRPVRRAEAMPIDAPSASIAGSDVLITGNIQPFFSEKPPRNHRVILRNRAGDTLEIPAAARNGVRPRIATSGDTLYLLWGEPRGPIRVLDSVLEVWPPDVRAIWLATRVGAVPWSEPRRIVASDLWISWDTDQTSEMKRFADGSLHIAIATDASVLDVGLAGATASVRQIPLTKGGASYADLESVGDQAVIVFIAPDYGVDRDQNSVFASHLSPEARAWTSPRLVSRSGELAALTPRVVITSDGAIHLIWSQSLEPGLAPDVLRHVRSTDHGSTWTTPDDLKVPGIFPTRARSLGPEKLAVLFLDRGPVSTRLMVACWHNGWRAPRAVAPNADLLDPQAVAGADRLLVATRRNPGRPSQFGNVFLEIP